MTTNGSRATSNYYFHGPLAFLGGDWLRGAVRWRVPRFTSVSVRTLTAEYVRILTLPFVREWRQGFEVPCEPVADAGSAVMDRFNRAYEGALGTRLGSM